MKEISVISKSIPAKSRSINYRTGDIAYRQSSSPASVDISGKLDKEIFDSVFKLHYDDPDNPNLPTSVESLVGFWTERWMSSMGLNPGTGGGGGGASTLGGLNNVGPWADEVPSADRVMVQLKGATHWTSKPLSEIVGLDTEALGNYLTANNYAKKSDIPSLSGYATEAWVTTKLGSYATASSLKAVSDKLDDFLTGTDTDTVINKWKELEAFLSGFKETDTLAGALALKADKTQLADYVTLGTVQTITGDKIFTKSIKLGGSTFSRIMLDMAKDTSTYQALAEWEDTAEEKIASIGYHNTVQRLIFNPTGVASPYSDALGNYSLVVGSNELKYNTYNILHAGNYSSTLDSRYVTKAFFSRLFKAHKADGSDIAVNDTDTDIDNIEALFGFWTERFMSSMGLNPGTGGGGGLIQSVYGYSDLGKTFSDDNLTDTFNAYTINKLADRLSVVESGAITSVDWGIITGKPTTLAGYGITDAYTKAQADGKYVALAGAQTITGIKTFTGHIMLGGSSYSSINHVFKSDASSYLNMGFWSNTNNVRVASIGYWNTAERIILNPIGSADQWENTVGKYNFIVGRNELTYNTYNILHTGNYTGALDGRYVKKSGDAMTGVLQFSGALNVKHHNYGISTYAYTGSSWEGGYKYFNTAGSAQLGAFGAYGSSNSLNFLYIGKSYDDTWLAATPNSINIDVPQLYLPDDSWVTGATTRPRLGRFDRGEGGLVLQTGSSNAFEIIDKDWNSVLFNLNYKANVSLLTLNHNIGITPLTLSTGTNESSIYYISAGPYRYAAGVGCWSNLDDWVVGNYTGGTIGAKFIVTPTLGTLYAGTTNNLIWHGGNLPKSSLWAGEQSYEHGAQENVYTPYQFISTFLNNNWAGIARRGSWYYAGNGQITTDWGNMHLAGTAYMAWGRNKTRTMLFITPSTRSAGADLTNEMMFYTCNEPNETYPSRWTRVLTSRNYNKYSPTLTGGGASGTWGIWISGNAASATKLQTARSLWGQSFDGTGNVSGSMSGVGTITPLSNNTYTLGTEGVRFSNAFVTNWIYAGAGMYMSGPAVTWTGSCVELSNEGNEMVVSSGAASDIHINYRAPSYGGRKAPSTWYWRAGSSSSWANFNLGSLTANGNISATGSVTGYSHYASEWYRSTGAYGWYNNTYSGGIYMNDSNWVKTYGKPFYSGNARAIGPSNFNVNIKAESASHAGIEVSSGNYTMGFGCHSNGSWYWWRGTANPGAITNKSYCMLYNGSTWSFYGILHATVGMYTDGYASALGLNTSSDMRLKNKVRDITIPVRAIAEAPSFEYTWKSGKGGLEAGSSAQYWLNVVTPCVNANTEGYYAMRYGQIALLSCISISKELLKSIGRVESLEDKVKRLERENRELLEFKRKVEQRLSA